MPLPWAKLTQLRHDRPLLVLGVIVLAVTMPIPFFLLRQLRPVIERTYIIDDDEKVRKYTLLDSNPVNQRMSLSSMPKQPPTTLLEDSIKQGRFFELPDAVLLAQIKDSFGAELEFLKSIVASESSSPKTSSGLAKSLPPSPSQLLFGEDFDEVNRTLVGVLALRWIWNDDYDTFTRHQPTSVKLLPASFKTLRAFFADGLQTSDDLLALVTTMVINDLGKDPSLSSKFPGLNHDMVLFEAAKVGIVPSLERLAPSQRADVMLGLELGSELNAGQLAQAENVPGNLEGLLRMRGKEHAFALKYMEQLLDVAGAAGHADPHCAKRMIEPVFQSYMTVEEVALDIIAGNSSLLDGYNKVLTKRGSLLQGKEFRSLSVENPEERALLRLLTMGRTADKAKADLFDETFYSLPDEIRKGLVTGLNNNGIEDNAILPYYMPAMLAEGLENVTDKSPVASKGVLSSLMRFLGRVLEPSQLDPKLPAQGLVIERNLIYAMNTIRSEEFRTDPTILDGLEIPPGEVLKRWQTSKLALKEEGRSS